MSKATILQSIIDNLDVAKLLYNLDAAAYFKASNTESWVYGSREKWGEDKFIRFCECKIDSVSKLRAKIITDAVDDVIIDIEFIL